MFKYVAFTRRTEHPKLGFVLSKLDEADIKWRNAGYSFHAPIIEIDESRQDDAWKILDPIDDIEDDDVCFSEWSEYGRQLIE